MNHVDHSKEKIYVYLLAAIQFVHILDFVVIMPLGPTLMSDLSIGPARFGTLVSSYNFSAAIAAIFLSTFADRFDRKHLLMTSIAGFLAGAFWCFSADTYSQLLTARIVTGGFGGFLNALVFTLLADLVPYQRRGRAMGVLASSFSVASVLGIPSGLMIADAFGWSATFLYIALFTVIIGLVALFVIPNVVTVKIKSTPLDILKKYLKTLLNPRYLKAHLFMFMVSMSMFVLIPFLSPYAVKNMGVSTFDLKYMYLCGGLFTILTAKVFGKMTDQFGALKMFMLLALFSIAPVVLYSNAGPVSFPIYIGLGTFFMTLVSGRMIPCMTMVSAVPTNEDRGAFMSVMNAVRSLGTATATLISGTMISEGLQGELVGYSSVGHLSIFMIIVTVFLARSVAINQEEEDFALPT